MAMLSDSSRNILIERARKYEKDATAFDEEAAQAQEKMLLSRTWADTCRKEAAALRKDAGE